MNKFLIPIALLAATNCFAQDAPVGRATAHLFYMPSLQSPVLVDGYEKTNESPVQSEVWQLNQDGWQRINSGDYESRKLTAAALNTDKNEIFVFGGIGKDGYDHKKNDGLIFDGRKWTRVAANDIGSRDHHEMVYASHLKAYVMYGGVNGAREYDTLTWFFENGKWRSLNIPGPGKRVHHAMAYDRVRQNVVLYGGSKPGKQLGDTWEFDGKQWTRKVEESLPGVMLRHTMLYDPQRRAVLLHGGHNLWSWDGTSWKLLSDKAPDRMFSALCFNEKLNTLILFGGVDGFLQSDTWQWEGKSWKQTIGGKTWKWDEKVEKYVVQ